jgi:cytidylate kinase
MTASTTPQYRNITISGLPGCGSTTLLNHLRETLKFQGWKGFSGGEFMRAYAKEKGLFQENGGMHHDARHYEDDFDRQVDMGMRQKLSEESSWVIESWLAGFLGQQVPGVLKVLMTCSDEAVRVDRVVNRDSITPDVAISNMRERYDANLAKWSRMYAEEWKQWVVEPGKVKASDPIDFWRPDLYDIVIDTYSTNQQASLDQVLNAIQVQNS